MLCNYQ